MGPPSLFGGALTVVRDMGYKGTMGSDIGTREVNQVQLNAHAWCSDVADRGPALLGLGLDAEALVGGYATPSGTSELASFDGPRLRHASHGDASSQRLWLKTAATERKRGSTPDRGSALYLYPVLNRVTYKYNGRS